MRSWLDITTLGTALPLARCRPGETHYHRRSLSGGTLWPQLAATTSSWANGSPEFSQDDVGEVFCKTAEWEEVRRKI